MQLQTAHLVVLPNVGYLGNSASYIEIDVIFGPKTRFLVCRLLRSEDIENWRPPRDVPCRAAYFTYQTQNSLINIYGLKVMHCLKNRRFLMRLGRCHPDLYTRPCPKVEPLVTLPTPHSDIAIYS
jgi:hypothetical protein